MNSDSNPEISALRNQVFLLLVALILVSGMLTFQFYEEARATHHLVAQATAMSENWKQNQPQINNFINQLVAYGQAHPDFKPVLAKYGIAPDPAHPIAPLK